MEELKMEENKLVIGNKYRVFLPAWVRSKRAKTMYGCGSFHKTTVVVTGITNHGFYDILKQAYKQAKIEKLGLWSIAPYLREGRGVYIRRNYIDSTLGPMMSSGMLHEDWISKINLDGTWNCICEIRLLATQGCKCGGN